MEEYAYIRSSLGDFIFPYVFTSEHESKLRITEFPVHKGAPISDHAFIENPSITMDIGTTDVDLGDGESVHFFELLKNIQQARVPIELTTRLDVYENCLIEDIMVTDDLNTMNGLRARITFKVITITDTQTAKVTGGYAKQSAKSKKSAKPQTTKKTTNRGTTQVKKTEKPVNTGSTAYQLDNRAIIPSKLGGK